MIIEYDLKLLEAISDAEHLANKNPGKTYRIVRSVKNNAARYSTALETDPLPDHCEQVTSVTRHPLPLGTSDLVDVTMQVIKNLPAGVLLLDKVVVEYFPYRPHDIFVTFPEIFSYEFMSTEGRNVATWIPCLNGVVKGAMMQTGYDGRGRIWKNGLTDIENAPTRRLPLERVMELLNDPLEDDHHISAFRESHNG